MVRAVQMAIKRCQQDDWHPGKSESKHGARRGVHTSTNQNVHTRLTRTSAFA